MELSTPQDAAPLHLQRGVTPPGIARHLKVVDAQTGFEITSVISADAEAGTVSRFEQDADGNLIRINDAFQVITEERSIRIEWRDPPAGPAVEIEAA